MDQLLGGRSFRVQASNIIDQKLIQQYGKSDKDVSNQLLNSYLEKETGYSNFLGYILLQAKEGISIGHLFGGSYANIGTFFTWVYWFVELSIIIVIGLSTGKTATSQPFCELHNRWYEKEQHLGGVGISKAQDLLNLIKQKDFAHLGSLLEEDANIPSLEVYIQSCDNCNSSNTWFSIRQAYLGQKGGVQFKNILRTMITPSQKGELLRKAKSFKA